MSMRHRAVKAVLDKGYSSEWNDDHEEIPVIRYEYKITGFINAVTDFWSLGDETSVTATTVAIVDGRVCYVLSATGGVGNISSISHKLLNGAANIIGTDALPKVTMNLELGGLTADNLTHEFGMFDEGTTPFTANQIGAYFRISNN